MFPSCLLIFNITTNVAYLFVNTRGDAYISIHFFVSLEMANKVDITNNTLSMFCVIRLLFSALNRCCVICINVDNLYLLTLIFLRGKALS